MKCFLKTKQAKQRIKQMEQTKSKTFDHEEFREIFEQVSLLRSRLVDEASSVPEVQAIAFILIHNAEGILNALHESGVDVDNFLVEQLKRVRSIGPKLH